MPYYCTLSVAKRQLIESGTTDDGTFWAYLPVAAQRIEDYCGQNFDVRVRTRTFSGQVGSVEPRLFLQDYPLLSVIELTNGNGSVIAATDYRLLPPYDYPHRFIRLNQGTYWRAPGDSDECSTASNPVAYADDAIEVEGEWGFVRHYATCWQATGLTVNGAHTAADNALNISGTLTGVLDVGNIIRVGNEQMAVIGPVEGFASPVHVERGYNGTTAEALSGAEAIYVFRFDSVVELATAMMACAMYVGRNNATGDRVVMPDGIGIQMPADMPPKIKALLSWPYRNTARGGF